MLLVAKKEALGRVETEGAKFVEMSDLFAHESLCVITTFWLGTPKTFPKISQNFGKTFYLIGNIKVTNWSRTGVRVSEAKTARPNQGRHSGSARTLHCCAR
jgi:hypothetical protein